MHHSPPSSTLRDISRTAPQDDASPLRRTWSADIPQVDTAVRIADRERFAVLAERHRPDVPRADGPGVGERGGQGPGSGIPQVGAAIAVAGSQRAVRAVRHRLDAAGSIRDKAEGALTPG